MANLTNQLGYVSNPQFSGGEAVTPLSGSEFAWQNRGYGGIYVGTPGTLVVKTINGNVLTLVSASGFIPGLIGAVSASSTAANIIGFDPIPVALPTTTTSTSTSTTVAPTTSTTTAAFSGILVTMYSGSYSGTPGSNPTITGVGSVCYNAGGGGYPGPTSVNLYIASQADWNNVAVTSIAAYTDAGGTIPYTGGAEADLNAWGINIGGPATIRFFNQTTDRFESPKICGT